MLRSPPPAQSKPNTGEPATERSIIWFAFHHRDRFWPGDAQLVEWPLTRRSRTNSASGCTTSSPRSSGAILGISLTTAGRSPRSWFTDRSREIDRILVIKKMPGQFGGKIRELIMNNQHGRAYARNSSIDFKGIAAAALASAKSLLHEWLPGGRSKAANMWP